MCDVFHENLKAARLKKGLSQQEVADLVGVAKSTYSMWETGNREPNLMRIKALTRVLDVTGDELLGLVPMDKTETEFYELRLKYGEERIRAYIEALAKIR